MMEKCTFGMCGTAYALIDFTTTDASKDYASLLLQTIGIWLLGESRRFAPCGFSEAIKNLWDLISALRQGSIFGARDESRFTHFRSNTGVVNIYDINSIRDSTTPTPLKAIMNLTTAVKTVRFNPTGELLALASEVKAKQLRLVCILSTLAFTKQVWFIF